MSAPARPGTLGPDGAHDSSCEGNLKTSTLSGFFNKKKTKKGSCSSRAALLPAFSHFAFHVLEAGAEKSCGGNVRGIAPQSLGEVWVRRKCQAVSIFELACLFVFEVLYMYVVVWVCIYSSISKWIYWFNLVSLENRWLSILLHMLEK